MANPAEIKTSTGTGVARVNGSPRNFLQSDPATWILLIAAAVIALIAGITMYSDYRLNYHDSKFRELIHKGQYTPELVEHLLYLQKKTPTLLDYPTCLATTYIKLKRYPEAIAALNRAKELKPDYDVNTNMGVAYYELGNKEEADKHFKRAIAANPHDPVVNFYLGVEAFEGGRYLEAGNLFMYAALSPEWDKKAEPYRKQIQEKVLGYVGPLTTHTAELKAIAAQGPPPSAPVPATPSRESTASLPNTGTGSTTPSEVSRP
jgi:tetratricopeptide (TPR) repeat protein